MGNEAAIQGWKRAEQDFLGKKKGKKPPKDLVLMSFDMSYSQPDSFPSVPSTVECPQCLFGLGFDVLSNAFNSGMKIFSCSNSKQLQILFSNQYKF